MERRLGRDPFAQSGLDKIFTPVVEQATAPTPAPTTVRAPAPKPTAVKAKPTVRASGAVKVPPVSVTSTSTSSPSTAASPILDTSTSSKGLPQGWTRATFIVRQDLVNKVKRAAYWDRKQIKDLVTEALDAYLMDKKTD
jgi:hypothetical protein